MFGEKFKKAREYLGFSQNAIAKEVNLTHSTIGRIELNKVDNPNWSYIQYLMERGINPYFLIGKSKEVAGQKADIAPEEYETLKNELDELKTAYQKLEEKQEWMEQMLKLLKIDTEELENFRQKDE